MGSILPVIITFIAGYIAFSFKPDGEILNQRIVPGAVISLIVASSFGAFYGAEVRRVAEDAHADLMHQQAVYLQEKENFAAIARYTVCKSKFGDECKLLLESK